LRPYSLGLWVQFGLPCDQISDEFGDSCNGYLVVHARSHLSVSFDLLVEIDALLTHGAPRRGYTRFPIDKRSYGSPPSEIRQGEALLPAASYEAKLRRCQFVGRDPYRSELCVAPLRAFAVRADEKVRDHWFRGISHQLRAEPSHGDTAIRTLRGVELPYCFL
jgi:hypothetical protein